MTNSYSVSLTITGVEEATPQQAAEYFKELLELSNVGWVVEVKDEETDEVVCIATDTMKPVKA